MTVTIDDALTLLAGTGPEYGGGFSNHGPMASEALFTMERAGAVLPWLARYKPRLQEAPDTHVPLGAEELSEALGNGRLVGQWIGFFDRELSEGSWQAVLQAWVPRLAPGLMAAAGHGLLRTAHAARSLTAQDTAIRRHELAQGLGYWASRYRELPGRPGSTGERGPASGALAAVPRLHDEPYVASGSIDAAIAGLDDQPEFTPVINRAGPSANLSQFLSDLTATFAGVYLANPAVPIVFVHSVTVPSALRLIAPYLQDGDALLAARYAWQGAAALYDAYAATPYHAPSLSTGVSEEQDHQNLIDRAVATNDEHAIKFTDACLREHALTPRAVYLSAAADAAERL